MAINLQRWFQFRVLDLFLVTTTIAILAFLWRPISSEQGVPPTFLGEWSDDGDDRAEHHVYFSIWPDGAFSVWRGGAARSGPRGCRLVRAASEAGQLVLDYPGHRIRMQMLRPDATTLETSVPKQLPIVVRKKEFWSGAYRAGLPHGTWIAHDPDGRIIRQVEYRDGTVQTILTADGRTNSWEIGWWQSVQEPLGDSRAAASQP